jgi:hypothetical protein
MRFSLLLGARTELVYEICAAKQIWKCALYHIRKLPQRCLRTTIKHFTDRHGPVDEVNIKSKSVYHLKLGIST